MTITDVTIETSDGKYRFTKDMNEISGMGGAYEDACRRMLLAGMQWLDANPKADPQFKGYKGVYGVISDENQDAKDLSQAVVAGAGEFSPSGAMHQAVISSLMWIKANSWNAYVKQMTHEGGEVGTLKEKLKRKTQDYDKLWERFQEKDKECMRRGAIIAEKVLGWDLHPVSMNSEQRAYGPDAKTVVDKLMLGDTLHKFVDQAIAKMVN